MMRIHFISVRIDPASNQAFTLTHCQTTLAYTVEAMDRETGEKTVIASYWHDGSLADAKSARALALGAFDSAHLTERSPA